MSGTLDGKVALVMGASGSIGRAAASTLGERGAMVVVASRTLGTAKSEAKAITERGGRALPVEADFLSMESMSAAVEHVRSTVGKITVLVASGGPGPARPQPFLDTPVEDYSTYFQWKCASRLIPLRATLDHMIEQKYGKVVFVTTDAGLRPSPAEALVGAGAASLVYLTRSLGRELATYGIRVNCVSTTLTRGSRAHRAVTQADYQGHLAEALAKVEAKAAFGLNEPEDVAALISFFCGPESDQASGQVISVNGGLSF